MTFDLELEIQQWLKQLRRNSGFEDGDIAELEEHLRDHIEMGLENGSSAEQSFNEAIAAFGTVESAGEEMLKSRSVFGRLPKNQSLEFAETSSENPLIIQLYIILNYLKITIRGFRKDKAYAFINIIGLTTAMLVFCLIMLYVQYELSVDQYHENKDFIYRIAQQEAAYKHMGDDRSAVTMAPLGPAMKEELSEVEFATRIAVESGVLIGIEEEAYFEPTVHGMDPDGFNIFTFEYLYGNPSSFLKDRYVAVISESMAKKYYGDTTPIGRILLINDEFEFEVLGVIKDMPANSHFRMDIILPFEPFLEITGGSYKLENWGVSSYYTYLLLNKESSPSALEEKLPSILDKHQDPSYSRLFLQKFSDIHTRSDVPHDIAPPVNGRRLLIYISIALFILLIACINYVNLGTARASRMVKQVEIRKVLGASRNDIRTQFLGESFLLISISIVFSLILAALVLPLYRQALELDLSYGQMLSPRFLLIILLAGGFVGMISGTYPALSVTSRMSNFTLQSRFIKPTKGRYMRSALIITQFAISGCLILATIIVTQQLSFIQNRAMGFNKDQILTLRVYDQGLIDKMPEFKEELRKIPGTLSVSSSTNLPNNITSSTMVRWPGKPQEITWPIYSAFVDYDFVDLFDIEIVQGRGFSRESGNEKHAVLINETAARSLPWENPIGQELIYLPDTFRIVGVMKDFHLHSLHLEIMPLQLFFNDNFWNVSIKLSEANMYNTISAIKEVKEARSEKYPFSYTFFADEFNAAYKSEMKTGELIKWFAILAIIIACLGLFGIVTLTGEQRTKEIGIRKTQGASVLHLIIMLSRDLTRLVIIAFVLSAPIACIVMMKWLNEFAYHIRINSPILILTFLTMLVLAWITIGYKAYSSAISNPVDSLRDE